MKIIVINLASTDKSQVYRDVYTMLPDYKGGRYTQRLTYDGGELVIGEKPYVPGARIDVFPAGQRVIAPGIEADECRIDIHLPEAFNLQTLMTQVVPKTPDRHYSPANSRAQLMMPHGTAAQIKSWLDYRNVPYSAGDTKAQLITKAQGFKAHGNPHGRPWRANVWMAKDDEIRFGPPINKYRVLKGHWTQGGWQPPQMLGILYELI